MSRILLVDDDASLLKLMSMRLRSQGYEVDTADSAEGALDRLRQQRADLVLSDLRMGGMDGLALFERIQSQWLGMPVIIMTAHGTIPDAIQATRSGVFSFLTKPIDKDELLVTIEHALSLTRPKQQHEWQSLIQTRNPQMEQLLIQASSIAAMAPASSASRRRPLRNEATKSATCTAMSTPTTSAAAAPGISATPPVWPGWAR